MIEKIYAVKDVKIDAFKTPFFSFNDATALRIFEQAVNQQGTELHDYPEDFTLHRLGTYSSVDGEIIPEKPKQIAHAPDYKHEKEPT